jgi:gas vesicle protein
VGTTEAELRRNAEIERARMGNTLEAIGDRLSPERVVERRKAAVGQGFKRMREAVMGSPEYIEPTASRLRDQAENAASSAADAARSAADKVQHAPEMVMDQARGNPIAAGLVAFGIGALVATAFPKTRTEQHLVERARPQIDSAKDELQGAGRAVAADVREQTKSAADEVTSAGKEAASNVADEAKSTARRRQRS